ncbi:MAG: hypothetical protein SVP52_07575 [Chloroflexota bacterium]|nr:hypothetical protein [Chloroflexota bacterium]
MSESQSESITEHQVRLTATGQPDTTGKFEILCITAGEGNGWEFTEEVLKSSLQLWDGVHCFIDHAWTSRSVRDLAGQIINPQWDQQSKGIKATLKSFGPGGDLLTAFANEVLEEEHPPRVGFSADILFKSSARKVKEILRVISLDLVYDPARGGAFLRALNQSIPNPPLYGGLGWLQSPTIPLAKHATSVCRGLGESLSQGVIPMPEEKTITQETSAPPVQEAKMSQPKETDPVIQKLQKDQEAMRQLLGEHERQTKLDQALEEARHTRVQMCGYLLESGLSASKLPKPIQDRIRLQFKDKIFEPAELQQVIEDSRDLLSELSAAQEVRGPGRISSMFDEHDKLQAAVDDLFEAPRDESLKSIRVPRLSGVRELYLMLTGDHELHGGYYPDRMQLATTADFTGLVKNALNKIVTNTWDLLGRAGYDWWNHVSVTEHFSSLQDITGTLIGTVGDLPTVAEGAEYTELVIGDSPETASFTKYGGYIPLTLELIDRDETRKLKAYARELGSAGLRKISSLVAAIFTANAGVGPTMADTGALFNATAVATAGGHANLLTTALDITAWEAACQAVYNQPMLIKNSAGLYGTGPKMAVNPKFCLVPRALQYTAWQMLQGEYVREATYTYDNILKGSAVPVTVPEWTDATDWAAVCDPVIAPSIYVGERFGIMPEIYVAGDELSPAVFMNDEHRLKVRHFLAVWVNDFRPLHKSNVA